ncbi:hypothetical protein DYBT9623_02362 [Dyadobacter sp. CECT 9623]|uniref:DUF1361 domain-containing protein n=1 Tax=Dyadobacter linearis TaxID=2823330 RepID=A0ABM8UQ35_9BACT|nr:MULTISPECIES: DUF1361 domain-containing protein [unclassified Dyadobacter]MCE7058896.1 DUF1361 domain-containing protein [Dyadobacter sp. CY343]CAG5069626.1 hypothetical protein DYBT9623_02362 [Dyadobacter sp. CECT 9623]
MEKLARYLQSNQKVALLAFVSFAAMTLLLIRMLIHDWDFIFLAWNLFLAWVPLIFIKAVWEMERRQNAPFWLLIICLFVWLLFFPNAPYIITDLKHLRGIADNMIWYDSLMIFTFSVAGFLTGLYSIRIVHRIVTKRWNEQLAWAWILFAMILSGFGVYLGRYGRWNSWDILTQPGSLLRGILESAQNPLAIKHTLSFSFVLMLLYFAFHIFAELKQNERTRRYP